jgi:phage protein D
MSDAALARRTKLLVSIGGVDASKIVNDRLISLIYTDNEAEPDDLQLTLADRDGRVCKQWIGSDADSLKLTAVIVRENWNSDGKDDMLDCGDFPVDDIDPKGPPSTVTFKASALEYTSTIRQTKKSKAWEKYTLRRIAEEIAATNGMAVMYESAVDPIYDRTEQLEESDYNFLSRLSRSAGISLKATNSALVFFDAAAYEQNPPVITIERADMERAVKGKYGKYSLRYRKADTQYNGCRVKYTDPSGKLIEYTYRIKSGGQTFEYKAAKVKSRGEAERLAKAALRQKNKFEITGDFSIPGDTRLVAGATVELRGWGPLFDRRYIISRAQHEVSRSGYRVNIDLRMKLEGY